MSRSAREPVKPSRPRSANGLAPARPSAELSNKLKTNLRAGREPVRQSSPSKLSTN